MLKLIEILKLNLFINIEDTDYYCSGCYPRCNVNSKELVTVPSSQAHKVGMGISLVA